MTDNPNDPMAPEGAGIDPDMTAGAEEASEDGLSEAELEARMMAMLEGNDIQETVSSAPATAAADFAEFADHGAATDPAALSLLYDLTLPVAVELGRTRMSVQEVLALGRGSVVQLDRLAGEPIDVFVGDRRFAEGEVVVLGEQFGIRITRVIGNAPGMAEA